MLEAAMFFLLSKPRSAHGVNVQTSPLVLPGASVQVLPSSRTREEVLEGCFSISSIGCGIGGMGRLKTNEPEHIGSVARPPGWRLVLNCPCLNAEELQKVGSSLKVELWEAQPLPSPCLLSRHNGRAGSQPCLSR